jgi:serine/tyrosine/threonine adenylyltransferase
LMLAKLGWKGVTTPVWDELLVATLQLLADTQVGYHQFFYDLSQAFKLRWINDLNLILTESELMPEVVGNSGYHKWLQLYHQALTSIPNSDLQSIAAILTRSNPQTILLRPQIESIWEPIAQENNWEPFHTLLAKIRAGE